jgi:hypothetical protein
MISFYLANTVVSFNWHFFDVNVHDCCILSKLFRCKVLANITNNSIKRALIYINLADL